MAHVTMRSETSALGAEPQPIDASDTTRIRLLEAALLDYATRFGMTGMARDALMPAAGRDR